MMKKFFKKFSQDLGIDLGTSNTLIYLKDRGIVINEPSVVAINNRTDQIVAVGKQAQKMLNKTPPQISVINPLVDGVISDFEVAEKMLAHLINRLFGETKIFRPRPRVVIGVPLDITEVERKAVEDAAKSAGAREVYLIEKAMATAIGARLPVQEPYGHMLVDLGGGTTEIVVISLDGVVTWKSMRFAGSALTENIIQYVREHHNMLIGSPIAEEIKKRIGSATKLIEQLEIKARGRDLITGLPKEIILNDGEIRDALRRSVQMIIDDVKATLEVTPPELVADIYERGIMLAGGGAMLKNIDLAIAEATKIPVRIADDPLTCVARGTGIVIENFETLKDIVLTSANG